MDKKIIIQLKILKLSNIKPNFSELARQYGIDRRTVKRYYDGYEGKPKHRNKPSKLNEHYDIIKTKLSLRGANVRAVYECLITNWVILDIPFLLTNYIKQDRMYLTV